MPWKLMSSSHNYLGWLVDYSGLLGPAAGIMIADYFLVRHKKLDTEALYRRDGIYEYRNGFNGVALIALVVGIVAALIGKFVPSPRASFQNGMVLSASCCLADCNNIMMLGQRVRLETVSEYLKGAIRMSSADTQEQTQPAALTSQEVVQITRDTNYGTWRFQKGWNPMHIVDAEGCYITDANGKKYLDFSPQLMCMNLGHKNAAVIE